MTGILFYSTCPNVSRDDSSAYFIGFSCGNARTESAHRRAWPVQVGVEMVVAIVVVITIIIKPTDIIPQFC